MGGLSFNGGSIDLFSSSVTDEEKGLSHFQSEYHELSPYVEFFCTGGGCEAARKGFKMLEEKGLRSLGRFGIETLWSAMVFERLGPVGIELGKVTKRVNKAKRPMPTRRREMRRGARRIGRPKRWCCFGMLNRRNTARLDRTVNSGGTGRLMGAMKKMSRIFNDGAPRPGQAKMRPASDGAANGRRRPICAKEIKPGGINERIRSNW
jgi:hypothetical protein